MQIKLICLVFTVYARLLRISNNNNKIQEKFFKAYKRFFDFSNVIRYDVRLNKNNINWKT
jgi:hypothetical protein